MKQSQNQKINIVINNEVNKTKKKRKYVKKQKEEVINNPQLTAYNPNVLSKTSSVPSYGLKSINPVLDSTLGLTTSLLLDKLKQPEPTKEQYTNHIKPEPLTPIKQEFISPVPKNNINEFNITPKKNLFIPEEDEIVEEDRDILETSAVDEALEEEQVKKGFFQKFKDYVSPYRNTVNEKLRDKTLSQLSHRMNYLIQKWKRKELSDEEKKELQALREIFNRRKNNV